MADVFHIVPAPARTLWLFAAIGALLLAMTLLFAWFAYSSVNTKFEVSDAGLRIRSALYGRAIPASQLRASEARVVNLGQEVPLQPSWRTNGIGMPGYGAGWFRLRGGGRALAFLTSRDRVVHVPTTAGYDLLLSTSDPNGLVAALQGRSTIAKP